MIQAHSAALHGSWNRPERTGYKVIRVRMQDGRPTGEYEDFVTGFVVDNARVWGRPAGVAVARDGTLLVSDDANGTIFRVTRTASPEPSVDGGCASTLTVPVCAVSEGNSVIIPHREEHDTKIMLLGAMGCVGSALRKEALHRGSVYHYRRIRCM